MSKKRILLFISLILVLGLVGKTALAVSPTVSSVTISEASAQITFDQAMNSDASGETNFSTSVKNLNNYALTWGTNGTFYPLHGDYGHYTNYVSSGSEGVAYIYGLDLTAGQSYSLVTSSVTNSGGEAIAAADTQTGTVASSSDPLISKIANSSGTAETNDCYGYPCGKAGEQITITGLRFNTAGTGVAVSGFGTTQTTSASDAATIVMNIPAGSDTGNLDIVVSNLNNSVNSNIKKLAVYDALSCGVIKGALTNASAGVGSDQNDVPVRLEAWNTEYGRTRSHNNGYYAVVAEYAGTCSAGAYDVFFTTPAGATQAAPTEVGSKTVAANTVTNAGTSAFAAANVSGTITDPSSNAVQGAQVTVHNDYWSTIQRALTDVNGAYKAYVPLSSGSNNYGVQAYPPYQNPNNYQQNETWTNIASGSTATVNVGLVVLNVQGTVKTPLSSVGDTTSNPSPNTVVPYANVCLHTTNWSVSVCTSTDSNGVFQMGVAAGSNYVLDVEAPWGNDTFGVYSRNTYSGLTIGATLTNLDTLISGGPRLGIPNVFGRVYGDTNSSGSWNSGEEIANVWVNISGASFWQGTNTNTSGKFAFAVSQAGTYHLRIDSPSSSYSSYEADIAISTSEISSGKNLGDLVLAGPNVTGTIYDPTGATGQANISIDICPYMNPGQCYWGQTDSNGDFGVGTVPNGTWQMRFNIWGTSVYAAPSSKILVISGGTVTTVDSVSNASNVILNDIRLADPSVNGLTGVVYGPTSSTGQQANLMLRQPGYSMGGGEQWANSNELGQFAFGTVAAGTYELEVQPNWGSSFARALYTITVAANGTVSSSDTGFTAVSSRNIIVRLKTPNITGTVRTPVYSSAYADLEIPESQFNQPVQWGWINMHTQGPMMGPGGWYGTNTNESGVFSFGGVAAGTYVIEYEAGWGSSFSKVSETITVSAAVAAGTESLNLNSVSSRASGGFIRLGLPQLRGTVVKSDGSTPVQNVWVNVYNPSNWNVQPRGGNTNSSGQFTIGGLSCSGGAASCDFSMEVNMPWGEGLIAPSDLSVTLTTATDTAVVKQNSIALTNNKVTLELPSKTISGVVYKDTNSNDQYDSGTDTVVTNARVEAHKDMGGGFVETRTNSSGAYSLKVGGGSWWVEVRPDWGVDIDWVYSEPMTRVTFANNTTSQTETKNFKVTATNSTITGYVKKTDGTAVSNVWVNVCQDMGMCNGRSTDTNGRFSIKVARGTYRVSAFPPGDLMNSLGAPDEKIVTVAANSTASAGTLTLKAKNSTISGKVYDDAGNTVSNVVVNIFQFAAPGWGMGYTDSTGAYSINVAAGTWGVMVMPMSTQYVYTGGPLSVTVEATKTSSGNNFTLSLADATIKGKVRLNSTSGDVVTNLWGGVWIKDTSAEDYLDFGGPMDDMMEKSGMTAGGAEGMASGGMGVPMGGGMGGGEAGSMGTGINNGAFELKVPAGTYEIGLGTPPGSNYTLSETATVTVLSDSDPDNALGYNVVNLVVIENDATISGHFFIDADDDDTYDSGEEVSGLRGMVNANKVGGGWQMTQSGSDGSYSLSVSAGEWYIDAFINVFMMFGANQNQYMVVSPDEKLTITAASANTLNFEVKALDATISGTITDPDGAAIAGVWVFANYGSADMLTEFKGPGGPGIGDFTDASGAYSMKVTGGTYEVGVGLPSWDTRALISPDFISVTVASEANSTGNDMQFGEADATISGTITLDGSAQAGYVRAWSTNGQGNGTSSTDGSYSLNVSQGTTWYVVAAAEISSTLHESAKATVVVDSASETQNLALVSLGLTVPDAKTSSFDASQSKTLTLTDGLTIEMPAASIETSGTVTVTVTPTVEVKPDSKEKPVGITYSFSARNSDGQEISDLAGNVTITMPYNEDLLESAGYSENSITPKYYNETTGTWENYDTVIRDPENDRLIIITDHFSEGGPVVEDPPTAPSGLSATAASTSSINLSWTDNSSDETGFKVYRNSADSNWTGATLVTTTAANVTSYTNTGLSASTTYYYRLKATNANGDSSWTSTASATTQTAGGGGGGDIPGWTPETGWTSAPPAAEPAAEPTAEPSAEPTPEISLEGISIPTLAKNIAEMTVAELKAKIAEFLTAISQLQTLVAKLVPSSVIPEVPAAFKFTAKLKYGQTSDAVRYLQAFLKAQGPDVYPEGIVSGWFGPLTKNAVIRFQEKYASDILAPWDLTKGTGLVGSTTITKINELLGR